MEMDDPDCKNSVPFEGLVIRKEGLGLTVFKLKTDAHYLMSTEELDAGITNIEDEQATNDDEDGEI